MSQVRLDFNEAKALAQRLADYEQIEYGVMTYDGQKYLIESEHESFYTFAKTIGSKTIVWVAKPGASSEEIFRNALEQIAYPANYPSDKTLGAVRFSKEWFNALERWMAGVASSALTASRKVS